MQVGPLTPYKERKYYERKYYRHVGVRRMIGCRMPEIGLAKEGQRADLVLPGQRRRVERSSGMTGPTTVRESPHVFPFTRWTVVLAVIFGIRVNEKE